MGKKVVVDEEFLAKKRRVVELAEKYPDKFFKWVTGWNPRPFQVKFMKSKKNRVIMVTSRQSGKSTSTAVKAIWRAWIYPNQYILVVSPTIRQSQELFKKIKKFVDSKSIIRADIVRLTQTEIEFSNGSIIKVIPGRETSVRGFTADMVIVDEAAYVDDDVFAALEPVLSVAFKRGDGQLILISTPGAPRGYFYNVWVNGSEKLWDKIKASMEEAEYDPAFIEEYRKTHTEIEFKREILGLFVDDDSFTLYPADLVKKCMTIEMKRSGPQDGYVYYFGVDIARSGSDYSAVAVIAVPEEFLDNRPTDDEFRVEVHFVYYKRNLSVNRAIGWIRSNLVPRWEPIKIGIDSIGIGGGVVDILREVYGSERIVEIKAVGNERVEMYQLVKRMMDDGRIKLPNDSIVLEHFSNYEIKYSATGKVQVHKRPDGHDDVADAVVYGVWVAYNDLVNRGVKVDVIEGVDIDSLFGGLTL